MHIMRMYVHACFYIHDFRRVYGIVIHGASPDFQWNTLELVDWAPGVA